MDCSCGVFCGRNKTKQNSVEEDVISVERKPPQEHSQSSPRAASVLQVQQLNDTEPDGNQPAMPEREKWGSKVAYILTLVGYAVGFGNIWRFPYQMRENGGLVFLIPYFIMLALVGIPIFFLELAVGQRRKKGVVYAWAEISPALGGIGIACGWLCFMVGLYYNTLLAYCLSYLVDSFQNPLPWSSCGAISKYSGNADHKSECENEVSGRATKYYWYRQTLGISSKIEEPGEFSWWLFMYLTISWIVIYLILVKGTKSVGIVVYVTAVFPYVVLLIFFICNCVIEPGKGWLGAYRLLKPNWKMLYQPLTWLKAGSQIFFSLGLAQGCLVVFASYSPVRNNCYTDSVYISVINCATSLFAALVVFPMIGLLGHRKYDECVSQMTALFPSSRMTEPEFYDNKYDIYFFTKAKTWENVISGDAAYNVTIRYGWGEINDKDAYDPRQNPDDILETVIGHLFLNQSLTKKHSLQDFLRDCSIGQEATASGGGTGFVFMAFTEAVKYVPGANGWSILFFVMLLLLGIDSAFASVEGVTSTIEDLTGMKRSIANAISCGITMILALVLFPFGWGTYVLDLLDQWTANWTLLVVALLECIAVSYDYGLAQISYDVRLMIGGKPSVFIILCWKFISPIVIILMLVGSVVQFIYETVADSGVKYKVFQPKHIDSKEGDLLLPMPTYALIVGFLLMVFCILWVPIHYFLRNTKYNMLKQQAPAEFPEEELREERHINVEKEEDQFTETEKVIIGHRSLLDLQLNRDRTVSQASIVRKTSSGNLSLK